ncbi:putative polysaccharide biosynthesis protein [Bacillus solimangrovi]|uniref:Uncharacterized protein n=1 Tax=Bacillus solimangrovi TaxID=1305675 RepID=A0A1E5LEX9_9BACI|nr:polysaccharide biosynthesis protein [Bacillus solimangrovi]OEH92637.1 hypothetical protein BFG57_14815 [Bacillus solimangrovi]
MNRSFQEHKRIWKGAWLLTVTALFIKILSAVYRIPYQNIAGDIGFYIYQQVYPIYSAAFILSTYGFPVVLSQMLTGERNRSKRQSTLLISLSALTLVATGLFIVTYFGASTIAKVMGDEALVLPLKASSFSFLVVPFLSTLRGYFQADQWMTPTAISQIVEQLVRVFGILGFAIFLLAHGYNVYETGAAAALSSVLGALTAVIVLLFFLHGKFDSIKLDSKYVRRLIKPVVYRLFKHGLLICISSLFIVSLQFIDAMTVLNSLMSKGFELEAAQVLKGVYDRSHPFVQLGATLAVSLSLTSVPLITQTVKKRKYNETKKYITLAYRVCVAIGSAASIGLALVIVPANQMLYETSDGSFTLAIAGSSIFFYSIVLTSVAVLQGYGDYWTPARSIAIGCAIKVVLNPLFVHLFAINGAAIVTVLSTMVTCALLVRQVETRSGVHLREIFISQSLVVSLFYMIFIILVYQFIIDQMFGVMNGSRLFAGIETITTVMIGVIVFGRTLVKRGYFSIDELLNLPFGEKFILFLGKRK